MEDHNERESTRSEAIVEYSELECSLRDVEVAVRYEVGHRDVSAVLVLHLY